MCVWTCIYLCAYLYAFMCICAKYNIQVSWSKALDQAIGTFTKRRMERTKPRSFPQTSGVCFPLLHPQGENNNTNLHTERDWPSMKQVGTESLQNEQINKQMGAWKEETVVNKTMFY